jgi:adenylate kinase family enzyme
MDRFLSYPNKYLAAKPALSSIKVLVLGGPLSGKSTLCRQVSERYNLTLIDVQKTIKAWTEMDAFLGNNDKEKGLWQNVRSAVKMGASLAPNTYTDIIQYVSNEDAAAAVPKVCLAFLYRDE